MNTRSQVEHSRKRWGPAAAMLVATLLIPAGLAAQDADQRIQSTLEQAQSAGIPVELLEARVAEGRAKGIPMDRIADAVQARLDGLARAQEAMDGIPDVDSEDLDVGADALESGVSEAALAQLAGNAQGDQRSVAIAVLTYLVDSEVMPAEALARVEAALARGPEALANLPAQARGPGAGGPPEGVPGGPPADVGAPGGIPAPGDAPAGGRPDGAGPPVDRPTGGGPPDGTPGPGGPGA